VDAAGGVAGDVMLPEAEDPPAQPPERAVDPAVASLVGRQFFLPEGAIANGHAGVFWTAMPETTVHEYGHLCRRKDEVGFAESIVVAAPAGNTVAAKQANEGQFRVFIAVAADAGHDLGSFRNGEDVRHG